MSPAAANHLAVSYNREVRPILSENCFACHGSDAESRKGKLRLDAFEEATSSRGGRGAVIIPGDPARSELVRRIFDKGDDIMPPDESHKVLTARQKETLKRWVAEGAKYEPHWAYAAPRRVELPPVRRAKWIINPIDQFVLAALEREKLQPAAEADRRTLARRVSLDLTGLPPAPDAVAAFVRDNTPQAYEAFVDALLASPRWGEHRARYWLDVARYADTHGIHYDNYREMWNYRDWVIQAFNSGLPYDRFTLEQLAGDLLPGATRDQLVASGFNRNHATSNEGGAIDEEYLVLYAQDRTETTAQAWLGMTAGCAVCHDHKYDPLTQKEFYSLSALFSNTTQKAMDGNVKDTPPVIFIPNPDEEVRWSELTNEVARLEESMEARKTAARLDFTNWLSRPVFDVLEAGMPAGKPLFHAALSGGPGTNVQPGAVTELAFTLSGTNALVFPDAGDFERTNAFSLTVWVRANEATNGFLLGRMAGTNANLRGWELSLEDGKPFLRLVHTWPKDAIKVTAKKPLPRDRWNHVGIAYDGSSKARGVKIYVNGERVESSTQRGPLKESVRTTEPLTIGWRKGLETVEGAGLEDFGLYGRELKQEEFASLMALPRLKQLVGMPAERRTASEQEETYSLWLGHVDAAQVGAARKKVDLLAEQKDLRERGSVAYVMEERSTEAEAHVLFRGDYRKRLDRVTPETPAFLPPMGADLPRNRLGFAQWLTSPANPLMARVTVNRFWQELFGVGLVKTSGDFGLAGEPPSNPELLDWLAVEFRESGWDVKHLYKLIVTSATYRQSAQVTTTKLDKDPENRLLSRGPRFRMDAEMVRDTALAASGLLVHKIGGPGVKPYQPPGIWDIVGLPEGNTREYVQDAGEGLYRRSVYTFWKRQAPPPAMEIFNAPSREICTVRRERTDTPLQALVTLNDIQFVEAARHLAEMALRTPLADVPSRLDFMAQRVLSRPLTARERQIISAGLKDFLAHYRQSPQDAAKLVAVGSAPADSQTEVVTLAAYTLVANQILNLDEALNK